jgi:hypothetical protein
MNSNPDNVFNLTGNTISTATTLTVPRSKYITARLLELRQLIDIHQDDLPTRRKTYRKYLEHYRKVRFELCKAAYASTGRSNLTPFQLSSKVEALAEKELTLRELVKMLSSNYEWMVEKIGALKKEEERLSKELGVINKKRQESRRHNMAIKRRAEVLKKGSEEFALAAGAAEIEGIL